MTTVERISLVGLGKLGLCLAAVIADSGIDVIGIDINEDLCATVNSGRAPWHEPQLSDVLSRVGGKALRATSDIQTAIEQTDITVVLVATPSLPDGSFSNEQVTAALNSLSTALRNSSKRHHLFVISSTVAPGSTQNVFIPLIEQVSNRICGEGFSVCFDPDFVALGSVIHDFQNPSLVLLGESDPGVAQIIKGLHKSFVKSDPQYSVTNLTTAETAKMSLNAYITIKISFANSLALISSRMPGVDLDAITDAIGADPRIGKRYLKGGLPFGGTCFPRDTYAFKALSEAVGVDAFLIDGANQINKASQELLEKTTLSLVENVGSVGVYGLAFKPGTPVLTESPGLKLTSRLAETKLNVFAYDPFAEVAAQEILPSRVTFVRSATDLISSVDVLVVVNPDNHIAEAIVSAQPTRCVTILDCWRNLPRTNTNENVRFIDLGVAPLLS